MLGRRRKVLLSAICSVLALLAGCGGKDSSAEQGKDAGTKVEEPVTLKMLIWDVAILDDEFKNNIADPVKAKYPNITVELVRRTNNLTLEQMLQTDQFDLIYEGNQTINQFIVGHWAQDMNEFIKTDKMDLNKFDPTFMNSIKSYGHEGQIYALPLSYDFSGLFYNKDLFDKFAVPYPKDGMTWDEVIDLMKRMTRQDGGVQYAGLSKSRNVDVLGSPYGFDVFDEKTGKAVIATDGWKKVFEMHKLIETYPGNAVSDNIFVNFVNNGTAMYAGAGGNLLKNILDVSLEGKQLNWDMATYPRFPDAPDRGEEVSGHVLLMYSTSNHKDEAFKVLSVVTSPEAQTKIAKMGRLPSLKDPVIRNHFGEDLPYLKGKNMSPILKQNPAPLYDRTGDALIAIKQVRSAGGLATNYMKGTEDVNIMLQKAEEAANKAIVAAKAQ